MKRLLYLICGIILSGCAAMRSDLSAPATRIELGGEPVVVVRGETVLPVVTEDTPEYRWAAMFLAGVIEEMCGVRPGVLVVGKGQTCTVEKGLFLGNGEMGKWGNGEMGKCGNGEMGKWGKREMGKEGNGEMGKEGNGEMGKEGFRVVAKDGSVRFLGRADYAVYDWCERELGMRYYCDVGKCVEKRDEIVVSPVDYSDRPVFEKREFGGRAAWARVAKAGNTHRGGVRVHAPHRWHKDAKLKREHPEIFETGETPMLCYGNPATLDCYKRRIERHIAGLEDSGGIVNTKDKIVTVCQWDAPIKCECKWCRTLYDYAGDSAGFASPVIWGRFLRKLSEWLKETHPDYMISFLPYWNSVRVPAVGRSWTTEGGSVLENCEAEVCTMPGLALLKDEVTRAREEETLRGWKELTGRKVINWHYGCWPLQFTSAPYVFGRTIRRHYRDMRDVTAGSYVCGGEGDPRIALSMYVWAKCLWNPDIDVEAVYDGFARRMFGPGAAPMRELIALQEACWERQWTSEACTYRNVCEVSYPAEDVARMKALLEEAYRKTREAGDDMSATRVRWYAGGMKRFFDESEFFAQGRRDAEFNLGETREMVLARTVGGEVWAKTTVTTALVPSRAPVSRLPSLVLTVRCAEPAAAKMDWTTLDNDAVWGDDCVTLVLEGLGTWSAYKTGEMREEEEGEMRKCEKGRMRKAGKAGLRDWSVTHDATGWTVEMTVAVPEEMAKRGFVRGNVSRWRVGDRRMPERERVKGSRYEHSRLRTRLTRPDDDPDAFVTFVL